MSLQAIVFDFDGLIIDTETPEFETWRDEFASRGVTLELAEWSKCVGSGPDAWNVFSHLEELLGGPIDQQEVADSRHRRFEQCLPHLRPREGFAELLAEIRDAGIPFGIASSSEMWWVSQHLTACGLLDEFKVIVTRDQVARPKPAPDLYLEAMRRLSADPAQCVAIEDSKNGIAAARAAGMAVVAVPNSVTETFDLSAASMRVDSLSELSLRDLQSLIA